MPILGVPWNLSSKRRGSATRSLVYRASEMLSAVSQPSQSIPRRIISSSITASSWLPRTTKCMSFMVRSNLTLARIFASSSASYEAPRTWMEESVHAETTPMRYQSPYASLITRIPAALVPGRTVAHSEHTATDAAVSVGKVRANFGYAAESLSPPDEAAQVQGPRHGTGQGIWGEDQKDLRVQTRGCGTHPNMTS